MTDRERLTQVRETVQTVLAEYERHPKPMDGTQCTMMMIRLRDAMLEIGRLTGCLRCGVREADGSGMLCTECWIETSDRSN